MVETANSFAHLITEDLVKAEAFLKSQPHSKHQKLLDHAAFDLVFWSHPEIPSALTWVFERGADVNQISEEGKSLLHESLTNAIEFKQTHDILSVLLKFGADIECRKRPTQNELTKHLIQINHWSAEELDDGQTPLLTCAQYGTLAGAKVLMDFGAEQKVKDDKGFNFLDIYRIHQSRISYLESDSKELLKWWLGTPVGYEQMIQQVNNPRCLAQFMKECPGFTQKWIATQERLRLDGAFFNHTSKIREVSRL